MYPIPPTEKLVETKNCRHCNISFPITDKDLEFYEKVSPTFSGKKYSIPTPTLCPDCRQQRRLSFRNERKLYKRKCDATGRDIISIYSPDKPFKVYHQDFWWSDKWDAMEYGRDFDFGRGFFEQFGELMKEVPKMSIRITPEFENCHYCHYWIAGKSCYMCVNLLNSEDCYYSHTPINCIWDVDWLFNSHNQFCYDCVQSSSNYECNFLFYSHNCKFSSFLQDCTNCEYCFCCVNLNGKKYYYMNQEFSKEEYENIINNLLKSQTTQQIKEGFYKFSSSQLKVATRSLNTQSCTGDFMINSKNCYNSFGTIDLEDSKYCWVAGAWSSDLFDCMHVWPATLCYEWTALAWSNHVAFSLETRDSSDIYHLHSCHTCQKCFWCIGLRNKSYCILNKQYTKEEYEELVPKIIEHMMKTGEWGEFFPSNLSPFGYNETVAQEYYPLDRNCRDVSEKHLYNWSDYEAPFPKVEKIIPASKLPDDISKIPDDILNWAIMPDDDVGNDENGNDAVVPYDHLVRNDRVVPFRIIKQELEFYRKHNLPIPKRHPDQRHLDRMALRNPRKLFERKCDKCQKDMITTYAPERPEMVYCEECYNREVIG